MTFKSRYEDFVDIIAGRVDPKRMLLRGRYRARGNLRWLWRAREMFPAVSVTLAVWTFRTARPRSSSS